MIPPPTGRGPGGMTTKTPANPRKLGRHTQERDMDMKKVAIPSTTPGGMDSAMGMHFGHCDLYTIVELADGAITSVSTLENVPHVQGGCMAPVQHLYANGVNTLLAGGMGMRPLMGFQQMGIQVYYAGNMLTVGQAVDAFVQKKLMLFNTQNTCGGGQ
jgi:predicted Fe-Mo cluster-binding NifX family protein